MEARERNADFFNKEIENLEHLLSYYVSTKRMTFLGSEKIEDLWHSTKKQIDLLYEEKRRWIKESESKGQTYAESFGFENVNWRVLVQMAETEEDWKELVRLNSSPKTDIASLFDSRCKRLKGRDDYHYIYPEAPEGYVLREIMNVFSKDLRKRDKVGALTCLKSCYSIYEKELRKEGYIAIPEPPLPKRKEVA
jgi:hypothetical protein